MPILKTATTPNGAALAYHRPTRLEVDFAANTVMVHVASFIDEAGFISGKPRAWVWYVILPVAGTDLSAVEKTLIADATSPFVGGAIVADATDSLDAIKTRKLAVLNEACSKQITAGFHSAALGTDRLYPAKSLDQTNLIASVVDSLIPGNPTDYATPFWCAKNGTWAYEMHNAAQVQQVGRDGKAAIVAALYKNNGLAGQVSAATTASEVNLIVW